MDTTIKEAIKAGFLVKHGIQWYPKPGVSITLRSGDKVKAVVAVVGRQELPQSGAYDYGCLSQNEDGDGTFDTLFPVKNRIIITEEPIDETPKSEPSIGQALPDSAEEIKAG
jgi:hypothetical protein